MANDVLSTALLQAMARTLAVPDLVRATETLQQSGQAASVAHLYAAWIQHNGDHPLLYAVLFNYAVTLTEAGQLEAARAALERALALNPDFLPAYINLGRVLERQGAVGGALVQWSAVIGKLALVHGQAITYRTTALNQSARTLEAANQDQAAEEMLRQSVEIDPHQREVVQHWVALRQRQCEWPVVQPTERVSAEALLTGMSPLSAAAYTDDPLFQLGVAWNYNRLDVGTPAVADVMRAWPQAEAAAAAGGPLRVGYLCSDFREHALGYLLTEVPERHDRTQVAVYVYYCGPAAQDPLHRHFRATTDHWREVTALDDAAAARLIAEDGIQILVDLNGYTRDARPKLVARRPAPVIVNWLGYPGTMASPYHHYLIADEWIVPESHEPYYSERVVRLPCYQPSHTRRAVAEPRPTRAEAGLPEEAMVYCCFNGAHKLTRFTFERWLLILARVEGAVLWLLGSTAAAQERLRALAAARGIAPERIVFAEKVANPRHLARYPLADLFLDTTPYGAHTTASDALWMGVPVLTWSGRSFASRVCGSLVRAAGLPEMVCGSAEEYVERAVAYGRERATLTPLRERLQAGRDTCPLFDLAGLVRGLEDRYRQMWEDYRAGRRPQPELAHLDLFLELGARTAHEDREVQSVPDYTAWWQEKLAQRHAVRPLPPTLALPSAYLRR